MPALGRAETEEAFELCKCCLYYFFCFDSVWVIGQAAQAGAHVVKFQTFQTKGFIRPEDKVRYEKLKSFELSFQDFERLSEVAKGLGITFLSTPLDIESAKFLNTISDAFKIASGDNLFFPLLETVAQFQKPTLLSTGMTTVPEIRRSKEYLENIWNQKQTKPGLALLHCVSSYPVPAEQDAKQVALV